MSDKTDRGKCQAEAGQQDDTCGKGRYDAFLVTGPDIVAAEDLNAGGENPCDPDDHSYRAEESDRRQSFGAQEPAGNHTVYEAVDGRYRDSEHLNRHKPEIRPAHDSLCVTLCLYLFLHCIYLYPSFVFLPIRTMVLLDIRVTLPEASGWRLCFISAEYA